MIDVCEVQISTDTPAIIRLQVRQSDFTLSARTVAAVNKKFTGAMTTGAAPAAAPLAHAESAGLVSIGRPRSGDVDHQAAVA